MFILLYLDLCPIIKTLSTIKEEIIWNKFVQGDKDAFSSIYSLYVDSLFSYGMKLHTDKDFIKDCIQDVFLDIYEHKNKLSIPKNINFYLFKVLKRTVFRKLKAERKTGDYTEFGNMYFVADSNIEKDTINKELDNRNKQIVNQMMEVLTSKQQEILYLKFIKNFNYIQISEITGIDHNSVRKQVYRAIKKLRESPVFQDNINVILILINSKLN